LDFIKFKNVCASKNTIKKVRRQARNGNNFYKSFKSLTFRIFKEPLKVNNKKTKYLNCKVGKGFENKTKQNIFPERTNTLTMRTYPILLVIRKMQIKTTMKYYLILTRLAMIKKKDNDK
jgi:stress response protein YsnF